LLPHSKRRVERSASTERLIHASRRFNFDTSFFVDKITRVKKGRRILAERSFSTLAIKFLCGRFMECGHSSRHYLYDRREEARAPLIYLSRHLALRCPRRSPPVPTRDYELHATVFMSIPAHTIIAGKIFHVWQKPDHRVPDLLSPLTLTLGFFPLRFFVGALRSASVSVFGTFLCTR